MKVWDKIKGLICDILIIDEWIKNGEFDKADTVIVVGTKVQAVMVRLIFTGKEQKINYCMALHGEYKHSAHKKWIVFDHKYKRILPWNDSSILWMPNA